MIAASPMALAPAGTLTLLFTDIEGSTRLVHDLGIERFEAVLRDHARIVREAVAANGGHEARTEGDSFFLVFRSAREAVAAAAAIQRGVAGHSWPHGVEVRVRIGMHSGEAVPASPDVGSDYVGYAVHVAARVAAAAHGGQVLISDTVRSLVEDALPPGTALRDLGEHRLRDAPPGRLHQLVIEGLPAEFPPLPTAALRPNNLPAQATRLIGRDRELSLVRELFDDPRVRLVTLSGPGGAGKTRLALEAGALLLDSFEDGVFLVPLAPVRQAALVPLVIARTIGVHEASGQPIFASLVKRIGDAEQLLVLDNFEQVVDAAPLAVDLLATCPRLKLLVTSRSVLELTAEREVVVGPLPVPGASTLPAEQLLAYPSVALFIERARALRPDATLSAEDVQAIAEICARLDGLPLALELAAARMRTLSPAEIASRLDKRLALLTGGPRDLPERQQTLLDTIAWSCELLDDAERTFFRRLAVFASSWTVAAAGAVCGPLDVDVLDGLGSLIRKSLVHRVEGARPARFAMLETVREYSEGLLRSSGEAEILRTAHAEHYARVAEAAEPRFETAELPAAIREFEAERHELRAALERSIDAGDVDRAARIAAALAWLWWLRGDLTEGRTLLESVLALPGARARDRRGAKLLRGAGIVATGQHDAHAREYLEDAVEIWRELGDEAALSDALHWLGDAFLVAGEPAEAGARYVEGLRLAGARERPLALLGLRGHLALNRLIMGDIAGARAEMEEVLSLAEQLGNPWGLAVTSLGLGMAMRAAGDVAAAQRLVHAAFRLFRDIGDRYSTMIGFLALAGVRAAMGDMTSARVLDAVAGAEYERIGSAPPAPVRKVAGVPPPLPGDPDAARAYAQGRGMSIDQAIAYALSLGAATVDERV